MCESLGFRPERVPQVYEEIQKAKIFNDDELRKILKTRESFEYRTNKQSKTIKDYLEFIAFERKLVTNVSKRFPDKYPSIVNQLLNHIKSTYKAALSLFPDEVRLWEAFITFCKKNKATSEISVAYEKMVQFHHDKPDVWLQAGTWEYYDAHNFELSKSILFRGLQKHSDDTNLYTLYFKIYLTEAGKMSEEKAFKNKTTSERDFGLHKAIAVYQTSKKLIRKIEYIAELLSICEKVPYSKSVQKTIIDDMMNSYTRDEVAWDILAKREFRGFHTCDLGDVTPPKAFGTDEAPEGYELKKDENGFYKRTLKRRIELCYDVYSKACAELQTEKMWSLFINAMIELNQDMSTQQGLKRSKLESALRDGHAARCLSDDHYYSYIGLLNESEGKDEQMLEVLQLATSLHPYSVKLWEQWMYYHIKLNEEEKVYAVFRRATKKIASEAYPLWRIALQYYQTRYDLIDKIERLFMEACSQTAAAFSVFRPQYLDWTILVKNLCAARELYNILRLNPPCCLPLHQRMAMLESQAVKPNIEKWRLCHDNACEDFGHNRTDVWIDFVKFERDHGNVKQMTVIYERAKESLHSDLVDNFISEYNLLKI